MALAVAEGQSSSGVGTIPLIVDLDAHVVEPPDVWSRRLPARLREMGPHIEYMPGGVPVLKGSSYVESPGTEGPDVAWWCYEDHRASIKRTIAAAGFAADEVQLRGVTYDEMRPGCWRGSDRMMDMDVNGVEAQLCFPNYPRFCGQQFLWGKDRELAQLCVEAYNDWMVDEWCGESGGRLIPLCLIPLWDPHLAAAEVRRNAARGVRAVCFSEQPPLLGLPSIHSEDRHWDPFVRACDETGTVICMHSGSGSKMPSTSPDAPPAVSSALTHELGEQGLADWLFSGLLVRFPNVRITFSEDQVGWIPYLLCRADRIWRHNRGWADVSSLIPEPPSTYYWGRVFGCFFDDALGLELIDKIGADQVTFETDYPHADGTWPHTKQVAEEQFGHLGQEIVDK